MDTVVELQKRLVARGCVDGSRRVKTRTIYLEIHHRSSLLLSSLVSTQLNNV